jgi:hypothetical protein
MGRGRPNDLMGGREENPRTSLDGKNKIHGFHTGREENPRTLQDGKREPQGFHTGARQLEDFGRMGREPRTSYGAQGLMI